jgi:hypothetical protein
MIFRHARVVYSSIVCVIPWYSDIAVLGNFEVTKPVYKRLTLVETVQKRVVLKTCESGYDVCVPRTGFIK